MEPARARTCDGVLVEEGLRVFTNDWKWGTVHRTCADDSPTMHSYHAEHPNTTVDGVEGCWHKVLLDDELYARIYNCDRIITRPTASAPPDPRA